MVTHFMLTTPRDTYNKKMLEMMLNEFDIKDWIIAKEVGKHGFKHYQVRGSISGDLNDLFGWKSKNGLVWHIEKASAGPFDTPYERKEGAYWTSADTVDIRKCRFGTPNKWQTDVLKTLDSQSDREVDVWLDPNGNHGKTWLSIHLWETGRALVVPRSASTPEKLSAFVCSSWDGEPIIIIDIPRAQKIDPRIYETIEELKDGLVFDHRYSGKTRNIRGTKICIFTNTPLDKKKLSHDRWRLHGVSGM